MIHERDLALIGIGHWGKNLARNYNTLGALHSVCDIHSHHINQYKKLYPEVLFTHSLNKILDNDKIKKIVIAVPTEFHFEIAKNALERGKDVFIEKAMSSNSDEAYELNQIADKKQAILMIGHILHYHPCIERIKEMIQGGDLGKLLHLNFSRLNFGSRGPEKSALWAFAPHDISLLLSLSKDYQLLTVECMQDQFYSKNYSDQSWISLNFTQNVKANIHVNWISPTPERKLTLVGTKGSVVFDDLKDWNEKLIFWENSIELGKTSLQFNQKAEEKIILETKEPLHEECKHFLECCLTRSKPITDGFEGFNVMKVLDLAQKSDHQKTKLSFETAALETAKT